MSSFFGQPSDVCYLSIGNNCVIVGEDLLNSCLQVLDTDGIGRDTVDNNSVGWDNDFGARPKAFEPFLMPLKLCGLCGGACENLYVAALELMRCDDFDRFGGRTTVYGGLYLLPSPGSWMCSEALSDTMIFDLDCQRTVFVSCHRC